MIMVIVSFFLLAGGVNDYFYYRGTLFSVAFRVRIAVRFSILISVKSRGWVHCIHTYIHIIHLRDCKIVVVLVS
ncbi:hypothetical protein BGW36DRAFT_390381 [Talaromyces proteolyticus]|uniref:Uncharacterized protein n=1 Tax=Talaromyces proteolyticus TaxID=1131652 RepID=A0AAD4KF76_9EURO|nr:uncharacterized protein BGW36DRAFT_390381 [Talaromyces proteolyticus]KAH8690209.1 hypothetical protein BGW36DRAFT_390381 [Talaromyces proteolyticus]